MQRELLRRLVRSARDRGELVFHHEASARRGFVDLFLEHIRELKRRDVLPLDYAKARAPYGDARQQQELAQLYADYQQQLTTHSLVDPESASWAARDALAGRNCQAFDDLELIVVDGFTDFTGTQHEILALLARRAKLLLIALQHDAESARAAVPHRPRGDLFAKTTATLAALRRHHPRLEVRYASSQSSSWPARDYLLENLFRPPDRSAALPDAALASLGRFEIIAAAGLHDEIVQIARRIKRLLSGTAVNPRGSSGGESSRVRPSDVLVVFRSLTDSAARIREVFGEFGIPYFLELGEPLRTTAVCQALQGLLKLDQNDWPFRQIVSTITNRSLTALDEQSRKAADWLVRDLQVANGRRTLIERTEELADPAASSAELNEHAQRRAAQAKLALPALRRLAAALDELPHAATASEWITSLARLARRLGLPPFAAAEGPETTDHVGEKSGTASLHEPLETPLFDALAWERIETHFTSLERLDICLAERPHKYSRREVETLLADAARRAALPHSHDDAGRVRILSAQAARSVSAKHVFLAGMSEQSFPAPERAGRLGSDAEYRFFSRVAHQDEAGRSQAWPAPIRPHEEMLLFYNVISCADESLTISYPALDDKAQKLPPSPYVTEIWHTLGVQAESLIPSTEPRLSPIPAGDACSRTEWRIQAVAQALGGSTQLLAGLLRAAATGPLGTSIDAGLRFVHARARRESFGPTEGLLTSPAVTARLAERFGSRHLWSPSQWEAYAGCPFKFFLEVVLGLEPLGDLELETDYRRRGSRLHDVLAEVHRQWEANRRSGPAPSPKDEAALFLEQWRNVVDLRLAGARNGIDAALAELDRRQILRWAERHFDHHTRYEQLWSKLGTRLEPVHFELRFGPARPGNADGDDPDSCNDAFTLIIDGEPVLVTGKIDRVDVARIGEHLLFNVIDYKSGRKASLKDEHIASGEHLQLPIYVAAAQALLFDGTAQPLAAGYWTMAAGFDAKGVLAVPLDEERGLDWNRTRTAVEERIRQFVSAIRHGEFPVFSRDDKCTSRCDFNTICRITQIRSLGKTWAPADARGTEGTERNSAVDREPAVGTVPVRD
jgi:superfamily I DNA/RNA helicase/RecB family exonuclease